jgi:hypothetical protein
MQQGNQRPVIDRCTGWLKWLCRLLLILILFHGFSDIVLTALVHQA